MLSSTRGVTQSLAWVGVPHRCPCFNLRKADTGRESTPLGARSDPPPLRTRDGQQAHVFLVGGGRGRAQVVRYYPNFDKAFRLLKALALEHGFVYNVVNERVHLEVRAETRPPDGTGLS